MTLLDVPYIMVRCLLLTIIIELSVALILKVRNRKDLLNIVLVNITTNPLVVSIPIFMVVKYNYRIGVISLIILEIFTVIIEGLMYLKILKDKRINPFILSLILNSSSYLIGEVINRL